ncbi:NADH dehydrogenase [ubiquinone] 1 beta subcomplex subunit 6 [Callorhinchus milii]|uniref:NADH dehydrogenase [ubiquinone] 1 beta subcomplex subunit 6 n=1 Tax=Callorhinchus milii TaxID=7868 RepID=K4GJE3_CALMI|nr:NADH dehydrogenase [ubiquinone] 1 beta subcomplex subunit 6 [Callorhinchus milii]AFM87552.1 NADH dehydrogenase (ubiquinone) 1 beta subcomplex, 6 [Callorhinchus milii]|eukprot:gi/632976456/ref/XP_007904804.1/ PREDICTED: NADH dehydrogenase [ubiquinone] 1 beta subcomplex subunit 6 [Callorhinchus milii]
MPLGYTADEKLRTEQLSGLRRRWLKDQELSPREPVLPPPRGPISSFWDGFLKPRSLWRVYTYKACQAAGKTITWLLIPAWLAHYYLKYHIEAKPFGTVAVKPRIFPGDTIMETGEVVPAMRKEAHQEHH